LTAQIDAQGKSGGGAIKGESVLGWKGREDRPEEQLKEVIVGKGRACSEKAETLRAKTSSAKGGHQKRR